MHVTDLSSFFFLDTASLRLFFTFLEKGTCVINFGQFFSETKYRLVIGLMTEEWTQALMIN
jgi:hypothetical protein